jgi:hypothetical protein
MSMHPSDGNTHAIERHLAERERYEDAQIRDMYCPACDETIDGPEWPYHVKEETCPNCEGELEEAS